VDEIEEAKDYAGAPSDKKSALPAACALMLSIPGMVGT